MLKIAFNRLKYDVQYNIPQNNACFVDAFGQSLQLLEANVIKNLPSFMRTEEAREMVGKIQISLSSFSGLPPILPSPSSDCCGDCGGVCGEACISGACYCCCEIFRNPDCFSGCFEGKETREARKQRRAEKREKEKEKENIPKKEPDNTTSPDDN